MHKCAIELERMKEVLVKFYNVIVKHQCYPKRWLDALDMMLEKGKGNLISKLRVIQIIEEDLQLLMRMFLKNRLEGKIEEDKRLSCHNHVSTKGYSIDSALLEKKVVIRSREKNKRTNDVFSV